MSAARRNFARQLPCLCCQRAWWLWLLSLPETVRYSAFEAQREMGWRQDGPSECAHLGLSTSRRGLSQKYPDEESGPLCAKHHREGGAAHHRMGAKFFVHFNLPRDAILHEVQRLFEESKQAKAIPF